MARSVYEPAHPNPGQTGPAAGSGRTHCKWVFSEERDTREGLFASGLELVMDTFLEPLASVGQHDHHTTEEVYYLLEGNLRVTTIGADGAHHEALLGPGDAHAVRLGQSHWAQAGESGARFLTIAVRV